MTTEKLKEQYASLDPEKVDELGDYLGLTESKFDNIKSSYESPMQRKDAYLDLYVHQHPCPSWADIANTLQWLGLHQQAEFVKNTYVKGTQHTSFTDCYTVESYTDVTLVIQLLVHLLYSTQIY